MNQYNSCLIYYTSTIEKGKYAPCVGNLFFKDQNDSATRRKLKYYGIQECYMGIPVKQLNPHFHFDNVEVIDFLYNTFDITLNAGVYLMKTAIDYNSKNIISFLLTKQVYLKFNDYSLIRYACTLAHTPEILGLLLEQVSTDTYFNINGFNGLIMAHTVKSNNIGGIKLLIKFGFKMDNEKFLYWAIKTGALESIHYLIGDMNLDLILKEISNDQDMVNNLIKYIDFYQIDTDS
jgi:hypothetical protein